MGKAGLNGQEKYKNPKEIKNKGKISYLCKKINVKRMDNKELIEKVAQKVGRSNDDVKKLMDGLIIVLQERLVELDNVAIPGFGTFEAKKKEERIVNNPSNGKRMLVPPRVAVNFKVSNVLKGKLK